MADGFQPDTATRPGTAFHAPQARLVTEAGAPITIDGLPIAPDIVSVKVTLLNSGVGQLELVLNNQRHDLSNRPMLPWWRYNGLAEVGFGARIRVDMRYGAEGWTPMILARITDMTFAFPQAAGAQVTLKGDDLASLLRVNPSGPMIYMEDQEIDVVEATLSESGSGLRLAADRPDSPFSTTIDVTREQSSTYLKFIETFAERMDCEVFVAFDDPGPGRAAPNPTESDPRRVSFHFVPSRSAVLDEMVPLRWGRDIMDFNPKFVVWDLLTSVTARGSVPRGRGTYEARATLPDAINDLHASPGGETPISAAAARAAAFAGENRPEENDLAISEPNLDVERAALKALAKLRASVRTFLTADITTIGFTRLRPGIHVDLSGFYAPFDGVYYVTKTVHTLNASGYLTVSSLRRPGMLDSAGYPGI